MHSSVTYDEGSMSEDEFRTIGEVPVSIYNENSPEKRMFESRRDQDSLKTTCTSNTFFGRTTYDLAREIAERE